VFKVGPLFFPEGEEHFTQFGDGVCDYGKADREAAYRYVKRWRRALDIGANVGIFSRDFAQRFQEVVAFEPVPRTRECLAANSAANVRIEPFAIADRPGVLKMLPTVANSGGSFLFDHKLVLHPPNFKIDTADLIDVEVRTIDSYAFDAVDLIKLDIQRAEYAAIIGARETIKRHRPVLMVEQKAVNAEQGQIFKSASKLLRSWGMVAKEKARSDRVFVFPD
jgi:FkbM family methyltransferase